MVVLKRVGVWSVAKFQAILMVIIGLIFGIFSTLLMSFITTLLARIPGTSGASTLPTVGIIAGYGLLALIIYPILFGIIGLIGGAIGAVLYNLTAKIVGGIEMEFVQEQP